MRILVVFAAAGLVSLAACQKKPVAAANPAVAVPAASPAAAPAVAVMPHRIPGLWRQEVKVEGHSEVSRICLDQALEQRFSAFGQDGGREDCKPPVITPHPGGGWDFAASCDMPSGGRSETKGTVTGDYAKSYTLTAQTTISGGSPPQMNGTHAMKMEARWEGPCPAGVQPGDMVLPGGMKMNIARGPGG